MFFRQNKEEKKNIFKNWNSSHTAERFGQIDSVINIYSVSIYVSFNGFLLCNLKLIFSPFSLFIFFIFIYFLNKPNNNTNFVTVLLLLACMHASMHKCMHAYTERIERNTINYDNNLLSRIIFNASHERALLNYTEQGYIHSYTFC